MWRVLVGLAAASRVYRLQLEEARPWLARLSEDYEPAALLAESVSTAVGQRPLRVGTVRQIESATVAALRDLQRR
jgi:hypothetical protein